MKITRAIDGQGNHYLVVVTHIGRIQFPLHTRYTVLCKASDEEFARYYAVVNDFLDKLEPEDQEHLGCFYRDAQLRIMQHPQDQNIDGCIYAIAEVFRFVQRTTGLFDQLRHYVLVSNICEKFDQYGATYKMEDTDLRIYEAIDLVELAVLCMLLVPVWGSLWLVHLRDDPHPEIRLLTLLESILNNTRFVSTYRRVGLLSNHLGQIRWQDHIKSEQDAKAYGEIQTKVLAEFWVRKFANCKPELNGMVVIWVATGLKQFHNAARAAWHKHKTQIA